MDLGLELIRAWIDARRGLFFVFQNSPQSGILNFMRFAPIVSILTTCLALNAQTIQGKVIRVSDGDTITILDEAREKMLGWWKC